MTEQPFDAQSWERLCDASAVRCAQRCLTPIHFVLILGQELDDQMRQVGNRHLAQATAIARKFGYETRDERRALKSWLHQERLSVDAQFPSPITNITTTARVGARARSFASVS